MGLSLFAHQQRADAELRQLYRAGVLRPLLVLPTGAGKTIVTAHIFSGALRKRRRALFAAPRQQIVDQTYATLTDPQLGAMSPEFVGVHMGQDRRRNDSAPIQVGCIDTLADRAVGDFDVVAVDECHLGAKVWRPIVERWPTAWVLCLTATPTPELGSFCRGLVAPTTVAELIALGRLSRWVAYVPEAPDLSALPRDKLGEYLDQPLSDVLCKPRIVGDAVEQWRRYGAGQQTLAFGVDRQHAETIAAAFNAAGIPAAFLHSGQRDRARSEAKRRFEAGEVTVLASCDALSEGYDCASAKTGLFLRRTHSLPKHVQQVGRMLRPFGSAIARLIDCVGNFEEHGYPSQPYAFSLEEGITRSSSREPLMSQCADCLAWFDPAPSCPECGSTREPKPRKAPRQVEGKLVEVTEASIPAEKPKPPLLHLLAKLSEQARHVPRFARKGWLRKRVREHYPNWEPTP